MEVGGWVLHQVGGGEIPTTERKSSESAINRPCLKAACQCCTARLDGEKQAAAELSPPVWTPTPPP